jgi:lysyl-tRNA synthetase class II
VAEGDQRYIAAVDPDRVLGLVREIRRLRRVEERFESLCSVLQHLNTFLERRGLVTQAQRFVEVRAQLERIQPEAMDADPPVTAAEPARGRTRAMTAV